MPGMRPLPALGTLGCALAVAHGPPLPEAVPIGYTNSASNFRLPVTFLPESRQ